MFCSKELREYNAMPGIQVGLKIFDGLMFPVIEQF